MVGSERTVKGEKGMQYRSTENRVLAFSRRETTGGTELCDKGTEFLLSRCRAVRSFPFPVAIFQPSTSLRLLPAFTGGEEFSISRGGNG